MGSLDSPPERPFVQSADQVAFFLVSGGTTVPSARADPSSLRLVQIGGGPLDRVTAERVGPGLGCRLQQVFGTAEGLFTLTRPADPDETVLTTQGRPLSPDDEIRVVDADGKDVPDGRAARSSPAVPAPCGATTGRPAMRVPSPPTATSAPAPSHGAPRTAAWW
ncbi:AMP-binding protein [Streptomyces sp. NPDC058049]|uniref:AMP-binding protein n=1 Tax=Streptomyces sp. NPDC058049 TaxID=3346314 RepID=UPI0036E54372